MMPLVLWFGFSLASLPPGKSCRSGWMDILAASDSGAGFAHSHGLPCPAGIAGGNRRLYGNPLAADDRNHCSQLSLPAVSGHRCDRSICGLHWEVDQMPTSKLDQYKIIVMHTTL